MIIWLLYFILQDYMENGKDEIAMQYHYIEQEPYHAGEHRYFFFWIIIIALFRHRKKKKICILITQ